jgi:hypothetical protein
MQANLKSGCLSGKTPTDKSRLLQEVKGSWPTNKLIFHDG